MVSSYKRSGQTITFFTTLPLYLHGSPNHSFRVNPAINAAISFFCISYHLTMSLRRHCHLKNTQKTQLVLGLILHPPDNSWFLFCIPSHCHTPDRWPLEGLCSRDDPLHDQRVHMNRWNRRLKVQTLGQLKIFI